MKIDFYASQKHFVDHMLPIWKALKPQYKGLFIATEELSEYLTKLKVDHVVRKPRQILTLVSSFGDKRLCKGPVVFMEHGVGFTFSNRHTSYAGGKERENVVLFLNNHQMVEDRNKLYYPNAHHAIIGTPKLDNIPKSNTDGKTVCISFHWPATVAPETGTAYNYYRDIIPIINANPDINLIMHGHPTGFGSWQESIRMPEIPMYEYFTDVMRIADIYVNDASSTMYEFAATGKPVIVLNAPQFRRSVNHGLRFWEYVPGPQVDYPEDLEDMILRVLNNPTEFEDLRIAAVEKVYPYFGKSAQRAADVIEQYIDEVYTLANEAKFDFLWKGK